MHEDCSNDIDLICNHNFPDFVIFSIKSKHQIELLVKNHTQTLLKSEPDKSADPYEEDTECFNSCIYYNRILHNKI